MDGLTLLTAIWAETDLNWLRELPAVQILWRVWLENYTWTQSGTLRWRNTKELPPASIRICSPYDGEAHASKKRSTLWVGYKVHLTETCDEEAPRLITNVETTPAPVNDIRVTDTVHQNLAEKDCLPAIHLVDSGYVDAEALFTSQATYEINLVGPTREDTGWQSRQGNGFAARDFVIDWENQQAICPTGVRSLRWLPAKNIRGKPVIQIHFSKSDCRSCPSQSLCTRSNPPRRSITVWPEVHHKALLAAREREKTEAFSEQYARRAGVEGVISQGVRLCGMRRARYIGLAKTHLQHLLTAMAINLTRVAHWLAGEQPAQTRSSAFVRLHTAATGAV